MVIRSCLPRILIVLFFILTSFKLYAAEPVLSTQERDWLKQHPVLTVGGSFAFKPLFIPAAGDEVVGLVPDMFKLLEAKLGIRFQYVEGDWHSILERVRRHEIDLVGAMNRSVAERYGFKIVKPPLNFATYVFAKRDRDFRLDTASDLNGLRVAYHRNTLYLQKYLTSRADELLLLQVDTPEDALNAVLNGKADVAVGMNIDSYQMLTESMLELEAALVLKEVPVDAAIGVRDDMQMLATILEKAIATITLEEVQQLLARWSWSPKSPLSLLNLTVEEKRYLQRNPTLRVQSLNTFPPFNFSEAGTAKGYSIDYMRLLGKVIGVDVEFIGNYAWHEHLRMLKNGQLDVIPHIAVTEERKRFVDFTEFNHVEYVSAIISRREDKIADLQTLRGKVIAVAKKTFLHTYLHDNYPEITLLLTASTSEAVTAVATGRADAVVGSLPAMSYYVQKDWLGNLEQIQVEGFVLPDKTQLPMGVAKGNRILLSILTKAHDFITLSQETELRRKWMYNQETQGPETLFTTAEANYLKTKTELRVCIDPRWMPLEGIVDGEYAGITAEYMQIFEQALDRPIRHVNTASWSESLQKGYMGECDFFSLIMETPERAEHLIFTQPYVNIPLVLVTEINVPFVSDLKVLAGKKIGVVKDYAVKPELVAQFPEVEFVDVANADVGLRMVSDGELFGFADALPVMGYKIQESYIGDLKVSGKFNESWKLRMGVPIATPELRDVLDRIIMGIDIGTHKTLQNKWVTINYQKGTDYSMLWQVVVVFVLFVAFMAHRNRSIRALNDKLEEAHGEVLEQQMMVDRYVLITTLDHNGVILNANHAVCKLLQIAKEDIEGRQVKELLAPDGSRQRYSSIWEDVASTGYWTGELKCLSGNGEELYLKTHIEPVRSSEGRQVYRAISENVTDRKRIEQLSVTDKLTGLSNRLHIDEILQREQERFNRHGTPFSVILLDIDDFKQVNDNYGHDVGDALLQRFAEVLEKNVRQLDTVGRWGGEEFIVICEGTSQPRAMILAEKLRQKVEQTLFVQVGNKTVSIGVSGFNPDDNISTLFKRADNALYTAKNRGKNCVVSE